MLVMSWFAADKDARGPKDLQPTSNTTAPGPQRALVLGVLIGIGAVCSVVGAWDSLARHSTNTQDTSAEKPSGARRHALKCDLTLGSVVWEAPTAVNVDVRLRNVAGSDVEPSSATFFLVPLASASETLRHEHTYMAMWAPPRRLRAEEVSTSRIDVVSLSWKRRNSSVMAQRDLFSAVPVGKYRLQFSINDEKGTPQCESEVMEVRVDSTNKNKK